MFVVVLSGILAVLAVPQLVLRRSLAPWLPGWARRTYDVLATALLVVPLALFLLRRQGLALPASTVRLFLVLFTLWHLSSLMLVGALTLTGVLRGLQRLRSRLARGRPAPSTEGVVDDPQRRRLLGATVAVAAASAVGASGLLLRRTPRPHIAQVRVPIAGLPPSLAGLILVQVSDVHAGVFMSQRQLEQRFAEVNDLGPDLVLMTGDSIDNLPAYVDPFARASERLRPRLGTVAVLGNHDFYTGAELVTPALRRSGVHVLRNQHLLISPDRTLGPSGVLTAATGGPLVLAGVDDPVGYAYEGRGSDLKAALEGAPAGAPRILLSHRPDYFPVAARHQVALTLSGHTHGGQLILPFVGSAARLVTPFTHGLYRSGAARLYVNRGLGVVGVPVRFNCPAEITRIELQAA